MADSSRACLIPGCQGNAHWTERGRRGWCSTHYQRWQRNGDPRGVRTPNGDPLAYMLAHMWDDCPKWPFYRHKCGYGEMTYNGKRGRRVHRVVCELVYGPPPTPEHVAAHNCALLCSRYTCSCVAGGGGAMRGAWEASGSALDAPSARHRKQFADTDLRCPLSHFLRLEARTIGIA